MQGLVLSCKVSLIIKRNVDVELDGQQSMNTLSESIFERLKVLISWETFRLVDIL